MKKNKMLQSMDMLDERFVSEASPENARNIRNRTKKSKMKFLLYAACIGLIVISLSLVMFIPFNNDPPSTNEYRQSEYYSIIEKLNKITYTPSKYDNVFNMIFSTIGDIFYASTKDSMMNGTADGDAVIEMAPTDQGMIDKEDSSTGSEYNEVTDNQVNGVIESDIIKRSDKYIFYLRDTVLSVYSIDKENSKLITEKRIDIPEYVMLNECAGFFLSEDCSTVTLIYRCYKKISVEEKEKSKVSDGIYPASSGRYIALVSLDVSAPEEKGIVEKGQTYVTGEYKSSRLVDGKVYLISQFFVGPNPDFSDEKTFLPQIDYGNGLESIPVENIFCPDELTSSRYTVITKIDTENNVRAEESFAFLSYSENVYVSLDSIYVTRRFEEKKTDGDIYNNYAVTEVSRLQYSNDDFKYLGSVSVAGYVKDQYSLDEYNGMLRIVTTTEKYSTVEKKNPFEVSNDVFLMGVTVTNANLYVVDINTMAVISAVERFAPDGETVRSVRFDRDAAYVCTSVQLTDPVFFFDLSDVRNITYKDTGTIDGFSESLINFGNGFLLGIGVGSNWDTLKIEVYEESENGVVSVCSIEKENVEFSREYKSYFIDRKNGMIGLGYDDYKSYATKNQKYLLLAFDNYGFVPLLDMDFSGSTTSKRGVYIDGYFYMFSDCDFAVEKIG